MALTESWIENGPKTYIEANRNESKILTSDQKILTSFPKTMTS